MFQYTINEDLTLRVFRLDDAEEFFQLTMKNKTYLKEWLGWLDYTQTVDDTKRIFAKGFKEFLKQEATQNLLPSCIKEV